MPKPSKPSALDEDKELVTAESAKRPYLSVVIPVYNEEENLRPLFERLVGALDRAAPDFELVFTDDGSADRSLAVLLELRASRPEQVKIVEFGRNFGQHMAVLAAFKHTRGDVVVTLDADLQNPPEEIPKLLAAVEAGHDVVGGYRADRQDTVFRRWASRAVNQVRASTTQLVMSDQGCMLRAYRREIVDLILESSETITFIPALAQLYATNPTEVEVVHAARAQGESKYSLYSLVRLNFDLVTGFTAAPLQLFTMMGLVVSLFSAGMTVVMAVRRLVVGPEAGGVFTLIGILFFLVGICITGIGIMGEYVARIYQEVRRRPPYVIKKVHE